MDVRKLHNACEEKWALEKSIEKVIDRNQFKYFSINSRVQYIRQMQSIIEILL